MKKTVVVLNPILQAKKCLICGKKSNYNTIFLHLSLGFKLQKADTFLHYENEYYKAMAELERIVTAEQFEYLKELSES